MRAAFYTLGCKVNQYETQALERILIQRGHEIVPFDGKADSVGEDAENICGEADAYVINTCSVTAAGDQKSRQIIRRVRREHPDALVAVCGCYAQSKREEVEALGADLIAGTGDRSGFALLLEETVERRIQAAERRAAKAGSGARGVRHSLESMDRPFARREFEVLPAGRLEGRTRAMLKIEDGCANFCTYCIIPYVRGPVRSVSPETAVRQTLDLAAAGVREIVLTGIEISSWGKDFRKAPLKASVEVKAPVRESAEYAGQTLIDLMETVCAAAPDVRFRLGSLEPRTVTEDFCRRAAALPNLCPQFHLSLQSGCDATLQRMRRKYDTARYALSVELLNRFFDRPAVTTDLITGFPGETDDEFAQTLEFLRQCAFARMHVFPYSPRPGTPAASMEQVPKQIRESRAKTAAAVAAELRAAYLSDCVGRRYAVLFEQERSGVQSENSVFYYGHAPNYAEVFAPFAPGESLHNEIRTVRILSSDGKALYGEIENSNPPISGLHSTPQPVLPDGQHGGSPP